MSGKELTADGNIGQRIVRLRTKCKMSQAELARRIGIKQPSLFEIESGQTVEPSGGILLRLSQALGVDPIYLYTGKRPTVVDPASLDVVETELVTGFRALDPQGRTMVLSAIEGVSVAKKQRRAVAA